MNRWRSPCTWSGFNPANLCNQPMSNRFGRPCPGWFESGLNRVTRCSRVCRQVAPRRLLRPCPHPRTNGPAGCSVSEESVPGPPLLQVQRQWRSWQTWPAAGSRQPAAGSRQQLRLEQDVYNEDEHLEERLPRRSTSQAIA